MTRGEDKVVAAARAFIRTRNALQRWPAGRVGLAELRRRYKEARAALLEQLELSGVEVAG